MNPVYSLIKFADAAHEIPIGHPVTRDRAIELVGQVVRNYSRSDLALYVDGMIAAGLLVENEDDGMFTRPAPDPETTVALYDRFGHLHDVPQANASAWLAVEMEEIRAQTPAARVASRVEQLEAEVVTLRNALAAA